MEPELESADTELDLVETVDMEPELVGRWPTELRPAGHWLLELEPADTELELVATADMKPEIVGNSPTELKPAGH